MAEARFSDTEAMDWIDDFRFPGVRVKVLETRETHPTMSMIRVMLEPGREIPTHTHPTETETAFVLAGEGVFRHGDAETILRTGMAVTIPAGLPHSLRNAGDEALELIAMHSPPTR